MHKVSIGRSVIFVSRTGKYMLPAIVNATVHTLNQEGVDGGFVPALNDENHVHLTVFTPGKPGKRANAKDFKVKSSEPISENVSGTYQEWNVPYAEADPNVVEGDPRAYPPGSWHFEPRV